jgi:hypothetical protein
LKVDLVVHAGDGSAGHTRRATDAREVRIPRAPKYFVDVVLDDWASDQWFHNVKPTGDDRLELDVRLPNRPSILVVDEGTGVALSEGTAHEAQGDDTFIEDCPVPGSETLSGPSIRADATGRILLRKTTRPSDWWIRAPDHAWVRVRVAPDDVARRVALTAGGVLRVEVEGVPEGEEAMVSATFAGDQESHSRHAVLARDADTGLHSMGGLTPGRWVVTVGRKADFWVREAWATSETEVVAGRTTDVRLAVRPRDPKASRAVEFELVVPAGWKERPSSISVRGCSDGTHGIERSLDLPEDASLPWRIRVEGLKDGPYQVQVEPYAWSTLVRVRRATTIIRVEVPAPEAVRVRVLDAKDGMPLSGAKVYVSSPTPWDFAQFLEDPPDPVAEEDARPTAWSSGGEFLDEGREASYEGQVVAGMVKIGAEAEGYVSLMERISIPASTMVFEYVMRLSRGGSIDVRIVSTGKTFEAAEGALDVAPKRVAGDDGGPIWLKSARAGGGKATFDGLAPGPYVVCWRRSTFALTATAAKEVTVRAGETVKVEFEAPAPPPK